MGALFSKSAFPSGRAEALKAALKAPKQGRASATHQYAMFRIVALAAILAVSAAAERRSALRSLPRDEAHAQRATTRPKPRSSSARRQLHLQPCPSTGKAPGGCPGYVVDHIVPLKRGGLDEPGKTQWQTALPRPKRRTAVSSLRSPAGPLSRIIVSYRGCQQKAVIAGCLVGVAGHTFPILFG
jgi:hypothetical protein